ncbi:Ca(2+)-dependent cysteine protease [Perkinsus chesapeaki]|uniref:Ca(2+)-dependent cysteine protease n=1 Tax=Perkinsus chesapeaki TaxID=330153 RepID=A0A7J6MYP0_PERCH|nr:Ca(2+)-dependent cysteine protease [Perkinsus chesapeaki]
MSITPPIPQSDIDEVRFLSPSSSDNEIEAALYKYHGNKDLAVNELLSKAEDQKVSKRSMQPEQMYTPSVNGTYGAPNQSNVTWASAENRFFLWEVCHSAKMKIKEVGVPPLRLDSRGARRSQSVRVQVECGMCHEVLIIQVEATRGMPLRARATCPHCQQLNEFDIPASQQQQQVSPAPVAQQAQPQAFAPSVAYPDNQVNSGAQDQPSMQTQAQYGMPATIQVQQATVAVPPPTLSGANIIRYMHWLVKDAKPGDIFFFHYSGHGAQQEDPLHLEEDGMNETIIPVDAKMSDSRDQIVDLEDLSKILG